MCQIVFIFVITLAINQGQEKLMSVFRYNLMNKGPTAMILFQILIFIKEYMCEYCNNGGNIMK